MWFKNMQIFQIEKGQKISAEDLETALQQLPFRACAKSLPESFGWVPPIGESDDAPLVYPSQHYFLCCMQVEEKILPPMVLRERHAEKIKELENKQDRKLYRDEKLRLKDELYHTLLTQAFSKHQKVYAYIDLKAGYLVIDASSKQRIEQFLSLYTKTVGDLPIASPDIDSPAATMTRWLKNQRCPAGLTMAFNCALQSTENERATARFTYQDLLSDSIQRFLYQGAQVTQMTFIWRDQIQFTLKNNFSINGLKFLDGVQDQRHDTVSETPEERFATDFVIMSETLHQFLVEFMPAMAEKVAAEVAEPVAA